MGPVGGNGELSFGIADGRTVRDARIHLDDIVVDEMFWGDGAAPRVIEWLRENYDERIMPGLVAIAHTDHKEGDGYVLIGWKHEGTQWPSLLEMIFGEAYANHQLALNAADIQMKNFIDKHSLPSYRVGSRQQGGG